MSNQHPPYLGEGGITMYYEQLAISVERVPLTAAQELQDLIVEWRLQEGLCSQLYADLRTAHPGVSRHELNACPDLFVANALRRELRAEVFQRTRTIPKRRRLE